MKYPARLKKPDIIGAIFGQTEGLLGPDLDLRELQKNGKIGRIEIESGSTNNKTYGKLMLPSSLGKVETCILAAAIESVDRVGPFETNFKIDKIDDTRNEKRNKVRYCFWYGARCPSNCNAVRYVAFQQVDNVGPSFYYYYAVAFRYVWPCRKVVRAVMRDGA